MPNWCNNHLSIKVPTEQRDALLAALEGPQDWAVPQETNAHRISTEPMSAHMDLAITKILDAMDDETSARRQDLIAAFKAHELAANARPTWMPVARYELREFWRVQNNPTAKHKTNSDDGPVALSVAKLAPWTSRQEFDRFFPGSIDEQGFWAMRDSEKRGYNSGDLGYIALHKNRLGVKWAPSEVYLHAHEEDGKGNTIILITFDTPWGPIETINTLLHDVLQAHSAESVLVWKEEDQNSGFFHASPKDGIDNGASFDHGDHQEAIQDEDDEDSTYYQWDDESLLDAVENSADASFTPRLS